MRNKAMAKIKDFAEKKNLTIYTELPEGFHINEGALTAPAGTYWIRDNGSIIQKTVKKGLLLDLHFFKRELRDGLKELEKLKEIANKAEAEYEADPMNGEKEGNFDEAYQNEYNAFMAVVELIVEMAGGKINNKTARKMVQTKRNEILALIE